MPLSHRLHRPRRERKDNFPCPPQGLAPKPALSALRPPLPPSLTRLQLLPPKPGNSLHHLSKCACAGTWHYVAARRAKARGKIGERRPVAWVRPSPAHCAGPASLRKDTPPTPALRWSLGLVSTTHVVRALPCQLERIRIVYAFWLSGCLIVAERTYCKLSNLGSYFVESKVKFSFGRPDR